MLIYLSSNDKILFKGMEQIIGVPSFLRRCVEMSNLDLLKYGISVGPYHDTILDTISWSVEKDEKEIASYLCGRFRRWDEYQGKYSHTAENSYQMMSLSKYRLISYSNEHRIGPYLCGLTHRIDPTESDEEEFIRLLKKNPSLVRDETRIAKGLGLNGTDDMITVFLDILRDIHEDMIQSLLGSLIYAATGSDSVSRVKTIFDRVPKIFGTVMIKSQDMYVFLLNRVSEAQMIDGILFGGNYRLFYRYLSKLRFTTNSVGKLRSIPPIMISELIKNLQDIGMNPIAYIHGHMCRFDSMTPVEYDLLRSHGMEIVKPWLSAVEKTEVDLNLFPHLQADLEDKRSVH